MDGATRARALKSKVEQGAAVGGWNLGGQAGRPHTYRQRPLLNKNGIRVEREHTGAAGKGLLYSHLCPTNVRGGLAYRYPCPSSNLFATKVGKNLRVDKGYP